MRIELQRDGFWIIRRPGAGVKYPWRSLLLFVLTPAVLVAFLVLAVNRQAPFLRHLGLSLLNPNYSVTESLGMFGDHNRVAVENLLGLEPERARSQIPTIRLIVGNNTLTDMTEAQMRGNPALGHDRGGDQPYYKAYYVDDQAQLHRCKVAYRGFSWWHHWPVKPSIRVRIKKEDITQGRRYLDLQRPEDVLGGMCNWLPEQLARKLGIVSGISDHVRLFINNEYFGVYLRTMRAGEPLALENGRMPGTFFKGDLLGGDQQDKSLWNTAANWNMFGEIAEQNTAVLDGLLATLRQTPSADTLTEFARYLDTEVFAKWAAVAILTGSLHTGQKHNHVLFLCPNQGKLEAVPWDFNSYGIQAGPEVPVDAVRHPIMDMATRDPRWVHRRNEVLYELVNGVGSAEALRRLIDDAVGRMWLDLKADPNLGYLEDTDAGRMMRPVSVGELDEKLREIKEYVSRRDAFLRHYFSDARVFVEADAERPGGSRITVGGAVAVNVSRRGGGKLEVEGRAAPSLLLYPGLTEELYEPDKPESVRGFRRYRKFFARSAPLAYAVKAEPSELEFANALSGEPVVPQSTPFSAAGGVRSVHPWSFHVEPTGRVVLGPGEFVLEQDLHVGRRQSLVIRSGTTVRLMPGVGIYSQGRTLVEGTAESPVELLPAGDAPWACFGVSGPATAGSRFEHLYVRGGSIGTIGPVQFKGMFNVYDCPDVVLRHCRFGPNHIGDDAVNLAESNILVEDCQWDDALFDAFDADMCTGSITRCRFRNSGNDGLDLMTCRLRVADCDFIGSGDKGISVGERTHAVIRDCQINDCAIGIEAKDDCRAAVFDTVLEGNGIGWHAYQKKWVYNRGGSGLLVGSAIRNSRGVDVALQRRCRLELLNSSYSTIGEGAQRLVRVGKIGPEWQQLIDQLD